MSDSLDKLLVAVQEMAVQNAQLGGELKSAHRRIDDLENLKLPAFKARTEERLLQGGKHFKLIDEALDEKLDKKAIAWLLTGISIGGGALGTLAAKLLGLF